jgi:hypothetical protein
MFKNHRNTVLKTTRHTIRKAFTVGAAAAAFSGLFSVHANALTKPITATDLSKVTNPVDFGRYVVPTYKESQPCSFATGTAEITWKRQPTEWTWRNSVDLRYFDSFPAFEASLQGCARVLTPSGLRIPQAFQVTDAQMRLEVIAGPEVWTGTSTSVVQRPTFFALADDGDYTVRATMWSAGNIYVGATSTFNVHVAHGDSACNDSTVGTAEITLRDVDRTYDRSVETPLPIAIAATWCTLFQTEGPRPLPNKSVAPLMFTKTEITAEDGSQIPVTFNDYNVYNKSISSSVWSTVPAGTYTVKVTLDRNGVYGEQSGTITLI